MAIPWVLGGCHNFKNSEFLIQVILKLLFQQIFPITYTLLKNFAPLSLNNFLSTCMI